MARVGRYFALTALLVIFGGCGAQLLVVDARADDPPSSAAAQSDTPSATPTETPAPANTPIPPPVTSPASGSLDFTSQVFDPDGLPLLGLVGTPDFLSLFFDSLMLDLLIPADRGGLADDFTHLELLCREGDDPDFICRQRYGH